MALFGGKRKKIGLFGTIDPYDTPGYGDGMGPGVMPQGVPERAQEAPKGIWNGGKFTARDGIGLALGAIGDGLAQHYGGQAMVAPMLMGRIQQRDEMKRAEAQYQRRRQDSLDDWKTQQDYKRQYPDLTNFQENLRAGGIDPRSPEGMRMARDYVDRLGDPNVTTTLPGDRFYSGPQSGLAAALGGGQQTPQPMAPPPQGAPSREEYGRFVDSLKPELRQKAWQAYDSGQLGSLPTGSPLSGAPQAPMRVNSQEEFNRLPSGTEFIAPDGSRRRKP